MKLVGRGDTTVVDAYLSPILRRYVEQVAAEMPGVQLYFMQSSGGLDRRACVPGQGRDPLRAGRRHRRHGAHRAARATATTQRDRLRHGRHLDRRVALRRRVRARVRDPGRRRAHARADDEHPHRRRRRRLDPRASTARAFASGPQSAGANPGPACYRRGGPLDGDRRQRDARQDPAGVLPAACSARAATRRSTARSSRAQFAALAAEIERATGSARTPEQVAEGFIDIAVGAMANAIKKISVARGYDVTRYTLQCFGGAGGQHACLVADALGMSRVFVHPLAGVLSAYGMGLADQSVMREAAVEQPLADGAAPTSAARLDALAAEAEAELRAPGRRRGADRACTGACTCATRAPTRRSSCRSATRARIAGRVRGRLPAALRLPDAASARWSSRRCRSRRSAPATRPPRRATTVAGEPAPRRSRRRVRMFSGGRWHDAALVVREQARPGPRRSTARRSSPSATRRPSSSPAGRRA